MNLPNKPIEYLAGGLPVLSGIRGYLGEVMEANDCGLCYEPGNPSSLAEAALRLGRDPARHRVMSENARRTFQREFEVTKCYGDMIDHFDDIISAYNRGAHFGSQHAK